GPRNCARPSGALRYGEAVEFGRGSRASARRSPGRVDHDQRRAPLAVGGLLGTSVLLHALPGAVGRLRAEEGERDPRLVLVLLHRRGPHPVHLRRLSPGPGLHPRAWSRAVPLLPQSLSDAAPGTATGRGPNLSTQGA